MAISKFERRQDQALAAELRRVKKLKARELRHRKIGWVIFFLVILILFAWLWRYFGAPVSE